jgi:hypothetical protein
LAIDQRKVDFPFGREPERAADGFARLKAIDSDSGRFLEEDRR